MGFRFKKEYFDWLAQPTIKEQVSVCRRAAENALSAAQNGKTTLDANQHLVDELVYLERLVQE